MNNVYPQQHLLRHVIAEGSSTEMKMRGLVCLRQGGISVFKERLRTAAHLFKNVIGPRIQVPNEQGRTNYGSGSGKGPDFEEEPDFDEELDFDSGEEDEGDVELEDSIAVARII